MIADVDAVIESRLVEVTLTFPTSTSRIKLSSVSLLISKCVPYASTSRFDLSLFNVIVPPTTSSIKLSALSLLITKSFTFVETLSVVAKEFIVNKDAFVSNVVSLLRLVNAFVLNIPSFDSYPSSTTFIAELAFKVIF